MCWSYSFRECRLPHVCTGVELVYSLRTVQVTAWSCAYDQRAAGVYTTSLTLRSARQGFARTVLIAAVPWGFAVRPALVVLMLRSHHLSLIKLATQCNVALHGLQYS